MCMILAVVFPFETVSENKSSGDPVDPQIIRLIGVSFIVVYLIRRDKFPNF